MRSTNDERMPNDEWPNHLALVRVSGLVILPSLVLRHWSLGMNISRIAFTGFVVLTGAFLSGCGSLGERLVFPGAATHGRPEAAMRADARYELLSLKNADH